MLTHVVFSLSPHVHSHAVSSLVLRKISPLPSRHRAAPELGCSGPVQSSVGHLTVGMVVDPAVPRVVHFCTSLGTPRRWSLCHEGLYANGVLHLSLGFALLGFQRSCTRLLWIVVLPLRPPGRDPAKALRVVTTLECDLHSFLCSCHRCGRLCASWSAGTSRHRTCLS